MMNRSFLPLFIILNFSLLPLYSQPQTLELIAWWPNGDEVSYSLTKSRIQTTNGDTTTNGSTTSGFVISVLDSTEEAYRLKWTYEPGAYLGEIAEAMPQIKGMLDEVANLEVFYTTFAEGGFRQLEDFQGLKGHLEKIVEGVVSVSQDMDSEAGKEMMATLKGTTLANEERLVGTYLRELHLFHGFYGIQLEVGDTLRYDESYPNPFGGPPFTGDGVMYISDIDVDKGTFSLINQVQMDPEATAKVLGITFRKLLAGQEGIEEKLQAMQEQIEFDIYTEIRAEVEVTYGWLDELEFTRTTKVREGNKLSTRTDKSLIVRAR